MTMETYEKKYKEALEKAKKELDACGPQDCDAARQIFRLFPELKESEDERIRKWIIDDIRYNINNEPLNNSKYKKKAEKAIAWLEKQGVKEISEPAESSEDKQIMKEIAEFIYNSAFKPKDIKRKEKWLTWLEKQSDKKPFDYENVNIQQKDFAPKVEPKFKVGNWYQCTKDFFGKGVTFDKNTAYYCAKEGCLQCEYGCHIAIVKDLYDNFKLWTIQDAEDGDVLTRNNDILSICIFSHFDGINNKYSSFLCHCGLEGVGLGQKLSINGYHDDSENYVPATKEQRDLLFAKIKEAGYEWDAENKILKKIKQKLTDKVELNFNVGDWIVKNDSGVIQHIKEIVNVNDETLYVFDEDKVLDVNFQEQYHLWSIQDAKNGNVLITDDMIVLFKKRLENDSILTYFQYDTIDDEYESGCHLYYAHIHPATREQRDLLFQKKKELKKIEDVNVIDEGKAEMDYCFTKMMNGEKVSPTWSEEDEKMLNDILMCGERHCYLDAGNIAWLKSLRDRVQLQNTITDEELSQAKKEAYNDALNKIEYHSGEPTFDDGWDAAMWYLKNIEYVRAIRVT